MRTLLYFLLTLSLFFFSKQSFAQMQHLHGQKFIEAKQPFPSVDIKITKDAKEGYNLQIITKNFKFVPEKINRDNTSNEGHAHLYVNGKKNRIYSEWYHISKDQLSQPLNQIRVTLNSNDHSEYVVSSRPIEAIGVIKLD